MLEIVSKPHKKRPARRFVPLKKTVVTGEVAGPLAALVCEQTFGYSRAQCKKTLEALYRFPLPGDAAVTGVTVRFGAVEIEAVLKEREQAAADYEEAKRLGQQVALATRESPDVFTLQVAGLQPDQEVIVRTAYVQLARAEGPNWTLRLPLTTSPRYTRSDEHDARHAQGQPLALMRDPGHRFALDVSVRAADAVESPTHALAVTKEDGGVRVRLADGEALPDRDCVLTWRPAQEAERPKLHVLLHDSPETQQVYFLALVAPPAAPKPEETIPREVTLLVDHSGSMTGAKWQAADWAVKQFLYGLNAQDTFALGLFHDRTRWFDGQPRTVEAVPEAVKFLEKHRDSGGTELGVALEQALHLPKTPGERARHLLIVTDAEVTDEGRILRLAKEEAAQKDRRRIHVLCIDAAPNSFLAQELAERGGGIAKFLTSDPDEEDISTALDGILEDIGVPVRTGLSLEVNRPKAEAVGREVRAGAEPTWSRIDVGDLPAGRAVWVCGRIPRGKAPDLTFRLRTSDGRVLANVLTDAEKEGRSLSALRALFGARRILALEFLVHADYDRKELMERLAALGYDPKKALSGGAGDRKKIYAENVRADANAALRELLVREALHYGLASAETAFVAVRTEAGKPVEETVVVANALPAGWSESFLGDLIVDGLTPAPLSLPSLTAGLCASFDFSPGAVLGATFRMGAAAFKRHLVDTPESTQAGSALLFAGSAQTTGGEAVLLDTTREADAGKLPEAVTLSRLFVEFPGRPEPPPLDEGLTLLIFVGDLILPRARVRLADILQQGGERPLNIRRESGQVVRLVLSDPNGAWAQNAPVLHVRVGW